MDGGAAALYVISATSTSRCHCRPHFSSTELGFWSRTSASSRGKKKEENSTPSKTFPPSAFGPLASKPLHIHNSILCARRQRNRPVLLLTTTNTRLRLSNSFLLLVASRPDKLAHLRFLRWSSQPRFAAHRRQLVLHGKQVHHGFWRGAIHESD